MLSLERFAAIRAAIERGGDRDTVLRDEGLDRAQWFDLQRYWLDALANELDTGSDTLATRYCRAFDAANAGAVKTRPPEPEKVREVAAPAPPTQTPSYLKPARDGGAPHPAPGLVMPPTALQPAPGRTTAAIPVHAAPTTPVVPFREGAPVPLVLATIPAHEAPPRLPTGTSLTLDVPRGPALPFPNGAQPLPSVPTPAAPGEPRVPAPVTSEPHPPDPTEAQPGARVGSGTAWAPSLPSGPATPFEPSEPRVLGFDLGRYAELVAARDQAGGDLAAVIVRFGIDASEHEQIEAYWRRRFSADGLLSLQFGSRLAEAQRALTASRAHPPAPTPGPLPELTVEQYAWLIATLRKAAPADLPAVLTRMRLTAETRKTLEDRWSKNMAADPSLQQRFIAALSQYLKGGTG